MHKERILDEYNPDTWPQKSSAISESGLGIEMFHLEHDPLNKSHPESERITYTPTGPGGAPR